jgi:hypothetical protein
MDMIMRSRIFFYNENYNLDMSGCEGVGKRQGLEKEKRSPILSPK